MDNHNHPGYHYSADVTDLFGRNFSILSDSTLINGVRFFRVTMFLWHIIQERDIPVQHIIVCLKTSTILTMMMINNYTITIMSRAIKPWCLICAPDFKHSTTKRENVKLTRLHVNGTLIKGQPHPKIDWTKSIRLILTCVPPKVSIPLSVFSKCKP